MKPVWIQLAEAVVLRVSGKDARRYLNNRLSNDIKSCKLGDIVRAAALTPQGRVEGLFSVVVENQDSFLLVCDGGRRNQIVAAVSRYIVADRVSVQDISLDCVVVRCLSEGIKLPEGTSVHLIPNGRIGSIGSDYLVERVSRESILEHLSLNYGPAITLGEYSLLRWRQGIATYPDEINEESILTESGMRDAVSFTKGCYVGQEVIERGDSVGRLPRALERIHFEGVQSALVRVAVVTSSGQNIGKVVSCASSVEAGFTGAFAFLRTGTYVAGDAVRCGDIEGRIVAKGEVLS